MTRYDAAFRGTTILLVSRGDETAIAGDGQVTLGETVVKSGARKIRRLYNDRILVGFAGATADSFALFSRLEAKLEQFHGNLNRAAVELAQEWRMDRALRHLEAFLLATDGKATYLLSGTGDVIEPDDGTLAVGSGGSYALAAARCCCAIPSCRQERSLSNPSGSRARFASIPTERSS